MTEDAARCAWSYPKTSVTLLRTLREARGGVDDVAWARFVDLYGPVVHHLVRLMSPGISGAKWRVACRMAAERRMESRIAAMLGMYDC